MLPSWSVTAFAFGFLVHKVDTRGAVKARKMMGGGGGGGVEVRTDH